MASPLVHLFVGSINRKGDSVIPGQGLAVLTFDEDTLAAETVTVADDIDNPSFLAVDAGNSRVYAVEEVGHWFEGSVAGYAFDRATGRLSYINKQPTLGRSTCHVCVTGDGHVAIANYSEGDGGPDQAMAVYRVGADGRLSAPLASVAHNGPTGPRTDRQERSHAHSVLPTPDGRFLLVADLGTDELVAYRLEGERLERAFAYKATPGAGPRHFTFHPHGRLVYVMNEIAPSVSVLGYDGQGFKLLQELSTLPEGYAEQSWGADIHLSPDGRHLYASTRVHDSIAVFAVGADGLLMAEGSVPSGGKWPRSFAVTPSGRHVLVANHNSDNIVIFSRDAATGALTATGREIVIGTPMRVEAVAFGS